MVNKTVSSMDKLVLKEVTSDRFGVPVSDAEVADKSMKRCRKFLRRKFW